MKMIIKFGVLLGTCVIVGSPLTGRAETPKTKADRKAGQTAQSVKSSTGAKAAPVVAASRNREVIYISREPVTGSLLPRVYRQYGNRLDTMYPVSTYSRVDIDRTGAVDVAGSLLRLDPSISLRR